MWWPVFHAYLRSRVTAYCWPTPVSYTHLGLPRTFSVNSTEVLDALEEVSASIVEAIHWVIERTPPELTGDISTNGIVMTGGGSLIWGFDKLVASKTGIPTHIADEAISCVAYGTGNCLENLSGMQDGTMNLSRQRQMMQ